MKQQNDSIYIKIRVWYIECTEHKAALDFQNRKFEKSIEQQI